MRLRERETIIGPRTLTLGQTSMDLVYPYGNGPWTYPADQNRILYTAKTIDKELCEDELHKGPPYKTGGPLELYKFSTDEEEPKGFVDVISGFYRYTGEHLPAVMPSQYLDYKGSTLVNAKADNWGDVSEHGAKGWNRFRPTKPKVDLGTFLGEIKEVPRMLSTTAKGFAKLWRSMGGNRTGVFGPKSVANHWLNTQFGWFPFISTLRDFHSTTKNLDRHLAQIRRDNGKWIRRRGTVDRTAESEVVYEQTTGTGLFPGVPAALYNGFPYGSGRAVRSYGQRVWFEGAFRYWIPGNPETWQWKAKALASIYGVQPNPSLVWELTPWSWLIDWCSNVGDVIANLSSIAYDGLCAKYAFIMGTTRQSCDYTGTANYDTGPVTKTWSAELVSKRRHAASAFGFGLSDIDFSARQWSILAALGITRLL